MPTYDYACKSCGEHLEAVQKFTDDALTECPSCGGELRKVYGNVGIVFKGSGFYKNDSRNASSSVTPPSSPSTTTESSSTASGDSSPAPAAPATPAPAATPVTSTPSPSSGS